MGTVTEGGTYEKDAEVIIEATATKEAYMFVKWSDGNTENPRTLTMTENLTLTAEFDYAYVDLGLSVKWATCNVGADSVHHYGNYYAWGETTPKTTYDWSTYFDTTDGGTTFLKYNNESGKTTLDKEDDAAAVNMGGSWRIPTKEELEELKTECNWTWCQNYKETGERGYIVTSKTNSNSIFLPSAGYRGTGTAIKNDYEHAYYASSSLDETTSEYTHIFFYSSTSIFFYSGGRADGRSVRGVKE